MPADRGVHPPRLAERWVRSRLPDAVSEAVAGDLEEEFRVRVAARGGRLVPALWYWGQVLTLRAGALTRVCRRLDDLSAAQFSNRSGSGVVQTRRSRMPIRTEDFRYAFRRLIRSPGFTVVAVLSLALGIGANTAMFSMVNAVLLRDLPVRAPEELVEVYTSDSDGYEFATSSYPDFLDLRERTDLFSGVVGTRNFLARLERSGEPEMAFGEVVSWDYFQVLGVPMALGRSFLPEEDATPGSHPVAILGYRRWVSDYNSSPTVLGETVRLNGIPFTIVGVAPEAFSGSMPVLVTGFYAPMMMTDALMGEPAMGSQLDRRGSRSMFIKARLARGVTAGQANQALEAFSAGLAESFKDTNEARVISVLPGGDVALHPFVDRLLKPVAALLLGVVGLVLLIACANLASFLLARAEERRKEIAIRLALGATRIALIRQLLVESTMLAVLGGGAGVVLANWTLRLLMTFRPPLPVPVDLEISMDGTVFIFTAGVSLLAGIAFGLAPALQSTNPDVAPTLKNEAGRTGKPGRFNLRNALVVVQVAFSFVLLIGAGLFVRSLQKAQLIDPGFDTGPAALIWPMTELSGYASSEAHRQLHEEIVARLLAHPSIDRVALADRVPLGPAVQTHSYVLPGVESRSPDGTIDIDEARVSPSYFDVMGVSILRGRAFTEADVEGEKVIVVSSAFVERYYPGEDLVGRTIMDGGSNPMRIIGVARDTRVRTLGEAPRPYVYELQGQPDYFEMQFIVRGRGTSSELLSAAKEVFNSVDPNLVYFERKTMNEHLALMLFPPRMAALLLSVFGGLALVLSAIGIYGVVSYTVARRTREMGIRMSLGASARNVVGMAVRGGMRLVLFGGVIGVILAGAVTWSIAGFLFGIGSTDIVTFGLIPVLLSGVALVAAFVPARRASMVDPVRALRAE